MARLIPMFSVWVLCAFSCLANTYTFTGSAGDGPVDAQATITLSGNTATVVLRNLETPANGDAQLISGFGFTLSGGITETGLTSSSGTEGTLAPDGDGDFSIMSPTTGPLVHWAVGNGSLGDCTGLTGISLCTLSGAKPNELIIGPPDDSDYADGNSSIIQHNPVVSQTATFVLALSGNANNATISGVEFNFGTSNNQGHGTLTPTPEPRGGALLLTLFGALVAFVFRRFRSISA
jgi:hypothetical protein